MTPRGGISRASTLASALLTCLSFSSACAPASVTVPAVVSPAAIPPPGNAGLRAGFGRADITPPPGVGLSGFGPDGERARGHRLRLYARVLLLEDSTGERIAFVATDLGMVSVLLHRAVAERVVVETGIGADRLLLSATHSHAGPGHTFSSKTYNEAAAAIRGFDPRLIAFLADRIAAAIREAAHGLTPAVLVWAEAPLWGQTWNRSYEAYVLNPPFHPEPLAAETRHVRPQPPPGLEPIRTAVDPTWSMLRVDTISVRGDTVPAAAMSIFAIHGTGNGSANDLFDGDVHALAERGLERHMDDLAGGDTEYEPRSIHLIANGAEGDVSPGLPGEDLCGRLALRRAPRPGGPRSPPALDEWHSDERRPGSACLREARATVDEVGRAMAEHATSLFDGAATGLRGDVTLARAFRTLDLSDGGSEHGVCDEPRAGSPAGGGTEDGRTGLHGWRILGLFPLRAEEGRKDTDGDPCHRPKLSVHWIVRLGLAPLVFPAHMDLMVVRVGDVLIAGVPAELTTEAGFRLKEAMLAAASAHGLSVRSAAVIGLANGYMQYVATPEEYEAQHYEGAATLYGPATLGMIEARIAGLIGELAGGGVADVHPLQVKPGSVRSILPAPERSWTEPARLDETGCVEDTVVARWFDAPPGTLIPADGPILRLTRHRPGSESLSIWDDDRSLEVRALRDGGARGYIWEARWNPPGGVEGQYTLQFLRGEERAEPWVFSCR